jgi:hypothetical protein
MKAVRNDNLSSGLDTRKVKKGPDIAGVQLMISVRPATCEPIWHPVSVIWHPESGIRTVVESLGMPEKR